MLRFSRCLGRWTSPPVILGKVSSPSGEGYVCLFGPLNYNTPRRWRKPVDSARTRLENRTRDLKLDRLMTQLRKLRKVMILHEVISSRKGGYASAQLLSRWKTGIELNAGVGAFLRKYPHVFETFIHNVSRNMCCRMTQKMTDLIQDEAAAIQESMPAAAQRLKKLLKISATASLNVHALWLTRRELGLPDDFRNSLILANPQDFHLQTSERVSLTSLDWEAEAMVEAWRRREHIEKWLSEYDTKYAFPVDFPTGFKMEKGFRVKLKEWQRLRYVKPYEKTESASRRSRGGPEIFEKRAVGIIHEFLSLTVEKMMEVERFAHFRKDFCLEVNVRELLLKHPGIFYVSTKGDSQVVFLREAYRGGCLVESNPVHFVRRRMMDLVSLGSRSASASVDRTAMDDGRDEDGSQGGGDWVVALLEKSS
ncbi:ubiquitin carboxyl-terminal hydrolase family protein [Wolffia australiana]